MKTKIKKTFDVMAYKEQVQAQIHKEIKDLTPEQEVEYFNRHAAEGPSGKWWRRVRDATARRKAGKG